MESLSNDALIPIVREKELKIKSFVMGFHEYRTIWTPHENEVLLTRMEPTNKKDKVAVAVIGDKDSIVGHLMEGKSSDSQKQFSIFYGQASIMGVEFMLQVKLSIKEMIKE